MSNETLQTPPNPEEQVAAAEQAREFMVEEAPHLAQLFGIDSFQVRVAQKIPDPKTGQLKSEGWSTNLETGEVTIDPSFFVEKGYKSEWAVYGTLHEIVAHLREVQWKPALTKQVMEFSQRGEAQSIFHNIMADIAGNKAIHARLPRMAEVAADVYRHKLFPDDPTPLDDPLGQQERYEDKPKHLQFLYKMIRDEMLPGSHTTVQPEVKSALDSLRNFQGSGEDAITYSTGVVDERGKEMAPEARFGLWVETIYPVYEQLLEQDKQDPRFQQQSGSGQSGNQQPNGETTDGQPSESQAKEGGQFEQYYQDYRDNRHPEPLSEADEDKLRESAQKHAAEKARKERQSRQLTPERARDQQLRQETGHGLGELKNYNEQLAHWQPEIDELRNVYKEIIEQRVALRRGLARQAKPEGILLDPNRLSQTVIDIKSGVQEPAAFLDYTERKRSSEVTGNVDYYFVADVSTSMAGEKAQAAAASTLIFLEGLSAMQADIEREEMDSDVSLELMVRSAFYTFGSASTCLKPLSSSLDTKERIDAYQAVIRPSGSTADYLALQAIAAEHREDSDRKRVIIVMSDGESDDSGEAKRTIDQLRSQPNTFVYGVSIGSDAAVNLYSPNSQRVDDPRRLPETMQRLITETIL